MKERIDQLAEWMRDFQLDEARWSSNGSAIEFRREPPQVVAAPVAPVAAAPSGTEQPAAKPKAKKSAPAQTGTPISSPMMGIYYSSPSPGSPPFVKEGDSVSAGQVIGLIEAMKVFNEITATSSGKVLKIAAENGKLVQPGDPLIFVG